MQKNQPRRTSPVKILVLVTVCSIIAGVILYRYSDQIRSLAQDARDSSLILQTPHDDAHGTGKKAEAALAKMKRTQLEREVIRLRQELAARERENAEMRIQMKLLKEGSRTQE